MAQSCPISQARIDANELRLNAFFMMITALSVILTYGSLWPTALLVVDTLARLQRYDHLSPFTTMTRFILRRVDIAPKPTDERPKRFALGLAALITLAMALCSWIGIPVLTVILAMILVLCTLFEIVFDFCIGCWVYYYVKME